MQLTVMLNGPKSRALARANSPDAAGRLVIPVYGISMTATSSPSSESFISPSCHSTVRPLSNSQPGALFLPSKVIVTERRSRLSLKAV